ncbi:OLC1v1023501C4 [Oldenlandia corymbosa var. corymbosa]|uniref:OLC1v1023501C4 n=1 Tax=Oldenlandia corymbosa var. corymbosa TaxID=529605 RepID=A0AAV1C0Y7_OLDCO|nr:OLC1v1023501C4 [Oldenlandia corymbosa var. corymbosa]
MIKFFPSEQLSPKVISEVVVHAVIFWISMGFLMPLGILIMRKANYEQNPSRMRIMFYIHAALQSLAVLLLTIGAILAYKDFPNAFNNDHQRLGVALYGLVWAQFFLGITRLSKGNRGRMIWYFVHWLIGSVVCLLGVIAIYTGLFAYHQKTGRNIRVWIILFTVEISFLILFYLLQEKWEYIMKQNHITAIHSAADQEFMLKQRERAETVNNTE